MFSQCRVCRQSSVFDLAFVQVVGKCRGSRRRPLIHQVTLSAPFSSPFFLVVLISATCTLVSARTFSCSWSTIRTYPASGTARALSLHCQKTGCVCVRVVRVLVLIVCMQDVFSVNPTAGVVGPGQRQLVAIAYEPKDERTSVVNIFPLSLPLTVTYHLCSGSNPHAHSDVTSYSRHSRTW